MKAIVQHGYGSPDVLRLEEIDAPDIGDEDVLSRLARHARDAVPHPHLRRLAPLAFLGR
jgi:hypothetical protein